jgi:hypothetical protein
MIFFKERTASSDVNGFMKIVDVTLLDFGGKLWN